MYSGNHLVRLREHPNFSCLFWHSRRVHLRKLLWRLWKSNHVRNRDTKQERSNSRWSHWWNICQRMRIGFLGQLYFSSIRDLAFTKYWILPIPDCWRCWRGDCRATDPKIHLHDGLQAKNLCSRQFLGEPSKLECERLRESFLHLWLIWEWLSNISSDELPLELVQQFNSC